MTDSHLVSAIDGDELIEYYVTSAPIETTYYSSEEDDSSKHITVLLFFASILAVLASILWIGAIVMSLRGCRRRDSNERQQRIEKQMDTNVKKLEREQKVMASILSRKITKVIDKGGIIELSEWKDEEASKTLTQKDNLENMEYSKNETDSNDDVELSSENTCNAALITVPLDIGDTTSDGVCLQCKPVNASMNKSVESSNEDADLENQKDICIIEERKEISREEDNNNVYCSVCLSEFNVGDELSWSRELKCKHVFHSECLIPWLMQNNECPFCRENIVEDDDISKNEGEGEENSSTTASTTDEKKNFKTDTSTIVEEKQNLDVSTGSFLVVNGLISVVQNNCYSSHPSKLPQNVQENDDAMLDEHKDTLLHERYFQNQDQQDHFLVEERYRRTKRICSKTYTAVMSDENNLIV